MSENGQEQKALVLFIKQVMDQIDEIACLIKKGKKASISRQVLNEMCSIIPELTETQRETYFDLLIKLSQHSGHGTIARYNTGYAEFSAPAKRRFIERIKNDLKIAVNS